MASPPPGTAAATKGRDVAVLGVDQLGVLVAVADRVPDLADDAPLVLDVSLDGSRVWSFRPDRDAVERERPDPALPEGARRAPWPATLAARLDGHARIVVSEHVSGHVHHDLEHSFGTADQRIDVVDAEGRPLAIDKFGDLVPTFADRSAEQIAPLLDAVEEVLGALSEAGLEPFLCYGTLLGAVRDGRLIGHDDDADLGYVSRHHDPVDATLESFRVQRHLTERGYRTRRYSGLAFKVEVAESDDLSRGLDVFGGFMTHGRLYLMGAVGLDYRPEWIAPRGTAVLEGRRLPVPADPDRLLAAMYGASWRVPDPSFHHVVPSSTSTRLTSWFRGIRNKREVWDRHYRESALTPVPGPSPLVEHLVQQEGVPAHVVDLGAGRGADSLWLARQGARVTAYDFATGALDELAATAAAEGLDIETRPLNLLELRSVLGEGARLTHLDDGPRVVVADELPGSTTPAGRRGAWRFASLALRGGGRLYLEATLPGDTKPELFPLVRPVRAPQVTRELEEAGATVVHHETMREPGPDGRRRARWVATWQG